MITYEGLYKQLSKQGHNKYWLRKNGISPSVLDKLGKGGGLDYRSINKLCALLNCQPGDLMETEHGRQPMRAVCRVLF